MLFSKAELQPTAIIENQKIQKTLPFKFESKLLPFQAGKCKHLNQRTGQNKLTFGHTQHTPF
jgi:hypothetical protein